MFLEFYQQIDIQQVVRTLENSDSPEEIFRSLAGTVVGVFGDTSAGESIINDVCSQEELVQVSQLSYCFGCLGQLLFYVLLRYQCVCDNTN